jgi:geranylgeranyl pyrophosphate synthase
LGADSDLLINLAAAVEMLHTATLVHDDIIDGSLMRRGVSTLNASWSPGATILTGDFIFARAAQLAAATKNVRVISIFSETLMTICNGELHQLFDGRAGQREREAYYARIEAKTASLFALASQAAAVLARIDESLIQSMRRFGQKLGMAFQIVDDVLDFTGQEDYVGKPLGSDLRQGLVTLPTIYFLESHSADERVLAVLNGSRHRQMFIEEAIEAIRESSAIPKSMDEARRFVNEAKIALEDFPASDERDRLTSLADYVVDRDV